MNSSTNASAKQMGGSIRNRDRYYPVFLTWPLAYARQEAMCGMIADEAMTYIGSLPEILQTTFSEAVVRSTSEDHGVPATVPDCGQRLGVARISNFPVAVYRATPAPSLVAGAGRVVPGRSAANSVRHC
jgi:hypothetical protein